MFRRIKNLFKNDNLEYKFLPSAVEIEETPHSPIHRVIVWVVALFIVGAFLWSYFGMVDEVATARGRVIPDGRVKVVQPVEEGIIKAILVHEGQRVRAGQALIELDPAVKQADVESSAKALDLHMLDKEMRMAELDGSAHPANSRAARRSKDLLYFQQRLRNAREAEFKAREDALKLVIAQKENAVIAAQAILVKLEKETAILKEQDSAYRSLYDSGVIPRNELLNKQKEFYAVEQDFAAQKTAVLQAQDSLAESHKNLDALAKEREKAILNDIMTAEKNIAGIEGEAKKARKRYELLRLASPVDGTVHGMSHHTVGGVVTPAQAVVTVVPDGIPLIFEATVLNSDIGFIKAGQRSEIKLDTFPFQKYGTIEGEVVFISPDVFDDEKLGPVYRIKVRPQKTTILVDGIEKPIGPGMTAVVEIKTGRRRVIEFFLSPIVKHWKESLTVR